MGRQKSPEVGPTLLSHPHSRVFRLRVWVSLILGQREGKDRIYFSGALQLPASELAWELKAMRVSWRDSCWNLLLILQSVRAGPTQTLGPCPPLRIHLPSLAPPCPSHLSPILLPIISHLHVAFCCSTFASPC